MKPVTTTYRTAFALAMVLALPLEGQSRLTVPLPPGVSPGGSLFANDDAVAFISNGEVHTIVGLRNPALVSHQVTTPPGPLAMSGPWQKLDSSTAVYLSTAGQLVLVRNLPESPILINTGIAVSALDPFEPWTDGRAVYVDTSVPEFRILSYDASGATMTVVPSPVALADAPWPWRTTYRGHFAGLGPGSDGAMGTGDDQLVWLTSPGAVFSVSWADLPAWIQPEGLVFNEHGTMAMWNSSLYPLANVTIIQLASDGLPSAYVNLSVSTSASPVYFPPFPPSFVTVSGGPGDSFLAGSYDDSDFGYCYRFIHHASTGPTLRGDFCEGAQSGWKTVISEYEVVGTSSYSCSLGSCGFWYERFSGLHYPIFSLFTPTPVIPVSFWHPNPASLIALLDDGSAVVVSDLLDTPVVQTLPGIGSWASVWVPGPGRVAGFFATGGPSAPLDELVLITAPGHPEVGASASFPFELEVDPAVPLLSTPIHIRGLALDPTYAGPATLFFASDLGAAMALGAAPFAPGSVVHLDLQTTLLSMPLPMTGGFGEVIIDPSPLPPSLAGLHFYVQAVFLDPAINTWFLSDAHLIVIG